MSNVFFVAVGQVGLDFAVVAVVVAVVVVAVPKIITMIIKNCYKY